MNNIAITTECVADIPKELLDKYNINVIHMDVATNAGVFRDGYEIDSDNITEYMLDGECKAQSVIPTTNAYSSFFRGLLRKYDEIIHISIGSGVSDALGNAKIGREKLGNESYKVHTVDSKNLSCGLAFLVIEAAKLRDAGKSGKQIIEEVLAKREYINMSFLANSADYLYFNGKISKAVMQICRNLHVHPLFEMKNGRLCIKRVYFGKYEKAAFSYVSSSLRKKSNICQNTLFIPYVGCGHEFINAIKKKVSDYACFDEVWDTAASATVAANSGPHTFGIVYCFTSE